ncbi:C-C motif chemokine 25 isoform X1 [Marmota marmota marmota]|uniref:C-C motif chemokine 25 isoform X1 n=1 Tax=Marmota marmota marmota TaxID=9994 RepID=UPI002092A474|nr:C-C motif chemokine 25 isoform X1 [Marmota marmota marmota]
MSATARCSLVGVAVAAPWGARRRRDFRSAPPAKSSAAGRDAGGQRWPRKGRAGAQSTEADWAEDWRPLSDVYRVFLTCLFRRRHLPARDSAVTYHLSPPVQWRWGGRRESKWIPPQVMKRERNRSEHGIHPEKEGGAEAVCTRQVECQSTGHSVYP